MTRAGLPKWDVSGKPRKPEIIGIGAQKAGTSWLSQMLGQHPRIWTPPMKEVQFFNHRFIEGHRYWIAWHYRNKPPEIRAGFARRAEVMPAEMDEYLHQITTSTQMFSNHWYKQIFAPAPADTRAMDVTPEYSTLPDEGVDFMIRFLPKARYVYIIRDPVGRAISQMKMNLLRENRRPADKDEWLDEAATPVLLDRGDYAAYVPRWQKRARDRLLILPYGDIARDPGGVMRRIEAHLSLPPWEYRGLGQRVFATPDKIAIPDFVRDALRERFDDQYRFLEQAFGADFLEAII